MKSVTKLKDDARKHEQKEEWEKAINAYLLVLKTGEEGEGELDLPLYNRVGDLYLRLSRPQDAVTYYVQAADRYAEAGLYNNAIALCNKAMRYVPAQLDLLRKLGQFSASQGFLTDARRYFLEYAEKKFATNQVDDALTALEEFADASDDADVREMLARQLHSHGRTDEAVDELKKAHAVRTRNGDHAGAAALQQEIETLAPGSMSSEAASKHTSIADALTPPPPITDEEYGFEIDPVAAASPAPVAEEPATDALQGFESTHFDAETPEDAGDFQIHGLESTHAEPETEDEGNFTLPDLESTALDPDVIAAEDLGLETSEFEAPSDVQAEALPDLQFEESSFGDAASPIDDEEEHAAFDLPLLGSDDADASVTDTQDATESGFDGAFALDGDAADTGFDLPTFDIEEPAAEAASEDVGDFALPTFDAEEDEHASDDGFDLPMLGDDDAAPVEEERADAPAASFTDFSSRDDVDFGEHGGGPIASAAAFADEIAELIEESHADDAATAASVEGAMDIGTPHDAGASQDATSQNTTSQNTTAHGATESDATAHGAGSRDGDTADANGAGWDPSHLGAEPPAAAAKTPAEPAKPAKKPRDNGDFIDLGALLTDDDDADAGTRFRVQEKAPTGDEDRDFAELLSQFKQKVSENVSAEDSAAHYDLGLAFKEMGLVDEAIGEFQIAMRAGDMRLRVYEELGQCFLLKEQFNIAEKVLTRALALPTGDELELIGVYYHLGRAYEGLGNRDGARDAYERVLGLDINFQDVSARLKRL